MKLLPAAVVTAAAVMLAVLGYQQLQDASADRDEADQVAAATSELDEERERAEAARAARLARAARILRRVDRLDTALRDLGRAQREVLPNRSPAMSFDRAVGVWNTGDHGGAVAIVDAEVAPLIAELRRNIARAEAAARVVGQVGDRLAGVRW